MWNIMKSEKREISSIAQVPQSTTSSTIALKKIYGKKKTFIVNVTVSDSEANIKTLLDHFYIRRASVKVVSEG